MERIKAWRDAFCSLALTVSGRLGEGRGRGAAATAVLPGRPPGGNYLHLQGEVRLGLLYTLRLLLQAPSAYGNDTSRNAGVLIRRMSQKQRNESYSLSLRGPPFTDISCGFSLTLSLTHSKGKKKKIKKAGFTLGWGGGDAENEKKRAGEKGEAETSSTFYSTSSGRSPRLSAKQGVCFATDFYLFVCF